MRRLVVVALIALVALVGGATQSGAAPAKSIVVDTHADTAQRMTYRGADIAKPTALHLDLPKMKKGGLDAQFFSIWVDPIAIRPAQFFAEAVHQLNVVHKMIQDNPKTIAWAKTAADVRSNAARGIISALFGVEGGHTLEPGSQDEQLEHLRKLAQLGARYLTLTWSNSNALGGSSGDQGDTVGLSDFGRRVLDELQRLGVMIDVSHVSDPMFWDVVRYAKKPVIASHSSARALTNHTRNLTDAMIKAVAKTRGAVCVNFNPRFLDDEYRRATAPLWEKGKGMPFLDQRTMIEPELHRFTPVAMARLVDHIEHIAKVGGIDHVCLGSDFDGIIPVLVGLEDVSKLPALETALRARGFGAGEIDKIVGGNILRVLEENETRK